MTTVHLAMRCCGPAGTKPHWELFVPTPGAPPDWPRHLWPPSRPIPTPHERVVVLASLGFEPLDGHDTEWSWSWLEDSAFCHAHRDEVRLFAVLDIRPLRGQGLNL